MYAKLRPAIVPDQLFEYKFQRFTVQRIINLRIICHRIGLESLQR